MASETPAAQIEARLRANWTTTPIFVENGNQGNFVPPKGQDGKAVPFVVLEFPAAVADNDGIGRVHYLEEGTFMLHVNVRSGTGATLARSYCDTLAAIFRGQVFGFVFTYAPFPPTPSEPTDGNYFRLSFGTPYKYRYAV